VTGYLALVLSEGLDDMREERRRRATDAGASRELKTLAEQQGRLRRELAEAALRADGPQPQG
jgi:hypothetical protein